MFKTLFMRGKFRTCLTIFIMLYALLSAAAALFLGKYVVNELLITHNLKSYLSYTQQDAERNINSFINTLNIYANDVVNDMDIFSIIVDSEISADQKNEALNTILARFLNNNQVISKVTIIDKHGAQYSFSQPDTLIDTADVAFIDQKASYDIFLSNQMITDKNGDHYLMFGKKFISFYSNYDLGYLLLYVKESVFYDTFKESVIPDIETFLSLGDVVVSHSDKTKLGRYLYIPYESSDNADLTQILNGIYIVSSHEFHDVPIKNLSITSIISNKVLQDNVHSFNMNIIILNLINVAFAVIFSTLLTHRLTKSMETLQKEMALYGSGKKLTLKPPKNDEILALETSFQNMIAEIDTLMQKNIESEKKRRKAELAALQAQINPHFIYNALDAISWMAKIKKQPEIVNATQKLAQFFRISLHKGENHITISEEIQHVNSYIAIEQIRFPDLFTVEYDIDPNILERKTIKIILQPLIENAIKHGFTKLNRPGIIKICGYQEGGDVLFQISDNGNGFDLETLKTPHPQDFSGGYGIQNVQERIELEYGPGYGLTFTSEIGVGTTVIVKIRPPLK